MTPEQQENFDLRRKLYHANTLIEELQQGIAEISYNIEPHHGGALGRCMTTKEILKWITQERNSLMDALDWAETWKKSAKKWWEKRESQAIAKAWCELYIVTLNELRYNKAPGEYKETDGPMLARQMRLDLEDCKEYRKQ